MSLPKRIQDVINSNVGQRIAYLVSRNSQIRTIIESVRELGSRVSTQTIETIVQFYRDSKGIARIINNSPFSKRIDELGAPTLTANATSARIKYHVDIKLPDGDIKRIYSVFTDCDDATTVKDLYACMNRAAAQYLLGKYNASIISIDVESVFLV